MSSSDPQLEPATHGVQSIDRAVALLNAVARASTPQTASELGAACGLNRSTAWRLLEALERHDLVARDTAHRYTIGHAVVALAGAAGHAPLIRLAHPHLRRLAQRTGLTAALAVPRRLALVYADQVQGSQVMSANWEGHATPLHASSTGKAFLAWLLPSDREAAIGGALEAYTERTIVDPAVLEAELAGVRERGYAISRGELEAALWGVAGAVRNTVGQPVAVISAWGAAPPIGESDLPRLGAQVIETAEAIAVELAL